MMSQINELLRLETEEKCDVRILLDNKLVTSKRISNVNVSTSEVTELIMTLLRYLHENQPIQMICMHSFMYYHLNAAAMTKKRREKKQQTYWSVYTVERLKLILRRG